MSNIYIWFPTNISKKKTIVLSFSGLCKFKIWSTGKKSSVYCAWAREWGYISANERFILHPELELYWTSSTIVTIEHPYNIINLRREARWKKWILPRPHLPRASRDPSHQPGRLHHQPLMRKLISLSGNWNHAISTCEPERGLSRYFDHFVIAFNARAKFTTDKKVRNIWCSVLNGKKARYLNDLPRALLFYFRVEYIFPVEYTGSGWANSKYSELEIQPLQNLTLHARTVENHLKESSIAVRAKKSA